MTCREESRISSPINPDGSIPLAHLKKTYPPKKPQTGKVSKRRKWTCHKLKWSQQEKSIIGKTGKINIELHVRNKE